MAKKIKRNLDYIDMVYTTISGFRYENERGYEGFKRDLDTILNSINYKSIISFTCSQTIGCLFTMIDGFNAVNDGNKIGVYRGADVIVDKILSIIDNEFTVEYVE